MSKIGFANHPTQIETSPTDRHNVRVSLEGGLIQYNTEVIIQANGPRRNLPIAPYHARRPP